MKVQSMPNIDVSSHVFLCSSTAMCDNIFVFMTEHMDEKQLREKKNPQLMAFIWDIKKKWNSCAIFVFYISLSRFSGLITAKRRYDMHAMSLPVKKRTNKTEHKFNIGASLGPALIEMEWFCYILLLFCLLMPLSICSIHNGMPVRECVRAVVVVSIDEYGVSDCCFSKS